MNREKIILHYLELLKNNNNFTIDPNLELTIFYYCNNNSRMYFFNDETLIDNNSKVYKRIKENMKEYVIPQILKFFHEINKESKISK